MLGHPQVQPPGSSPWFYELRVKMNMETQKVAFTKNSKLAVLDVSFVVGPNKDVVFRLVATNKKTDPCEAA